MKDPYKKMSEVDKIRYEREIMNFECGGISANDE
jgi:hypothetical protein